MNNTKKKDFYIYRESFIMWIMLIVLALIVLFFVSCRAQRHVVIDKKDVDSSVLTEKDNLIATLKKENETLAAENYELKYVGVTFDSSGCPPKEIFISSDCNTDSIMNVLNSANNAVKIYADGAMEAKGKLKSAFYSKNQFAKLVSFLQKENDSLRLVSSKAETKYITKTVMVDKKVKRNWFTGFPLWILILIAGYFLGRKFDVWGWIKDRINVKK